MNLHGHGLIIKKKYFIGIAAVILSLLFLHSPASHALKGRAVKTKKHFLWAVESERNTVYLLGSMHILKSDSYPLPRGIEGIYDCCKKVVFETDIDGMNEPSSQGTMLKRGMYPPGNTLSQNISGQTYGKLEKTLNASGLPIARFERFRPWFIALTITAMEIQRLGFDPELGVDRYFFNKSKRDRKRLFFLESNEFQINLMAKMTASQQEMFLRETLKELEVIGSMASDLVNAWLTGSVDKLNSILKISFQEYPEIYKRFFTERNRGWVTKIERLLNQKEDILIIVGAGHLVGKDSVVDLLKQKGYKVRQR